jgi:hypothetical protein
MLSRVMRHRNERPSVGKRALIALVRFLVIFCIGISGTLAWQSYGDQVREMIASSHQQLSWLASHKRSRFHRTRLT